MTENKAIDDLLGVRYKVIADYPNASFKVGSVWSPEEMVSHAMSVDECNPENFPHLFKKLEWWEERDKYNMPKYVSFPHGHHKFKEGEVVEVFNWYKYPDACIFHNHYHAGWLLPATEAEYFNQKQQGHEK